MSSNHRRKQLPNIILTCTYTFTLTLALFCGWWRGKVVKVNFRSSSRSSRLYVRVHRSVVQLPQVSHPTACSNVAVGGVNAARAVQRHGDFFFLFYWATSSQSQQHVFLQLMSRAPYSFFCIDSAAYNNRERTRKKVSEVSGFVYKAVEILLQCWGHAAGCKSD